MITEIGVKHLVRRGLQHAKEKEITMKDFSKAAVPLVILLTTVLISFIIMVYLSLGSNIIMTLTAVEGDANGYERVPHEEDGDESKEALLDSKEGKDEEDVPPPPYEEEPTSRFTTSLRRTFRHLRKEDGLLRFPFRGLRACVWYNIACMLLGNFFGLPLAAMFKADNFDLDNFNMYAVTSQTGLLIGRNLARMFLANMFVVVTHAQIASTATNKAYGNSFKRVIKAPWKNAVPTLLPLGIVTFSAFYLEFIAEGFIKQLAVSMHNSRVQQPVLSGCAVFSVFVLLALSGLSGMAMLRIHASSFPREDKTVVPVNFGFGMVPVSKEVKVLSFCQALRSYTRQDIGNIVVMFAKLSAINYFVQCILGFLIYAQVMSIMLSAYRW